MAMSYPFGKRETLNVGPSSVRPKRRDSAGKRPAAALPIKIQQISSRAEQNIAKSGSITLANQKSGGRCQMYFSHDTDNIQVGFNGYWIDDAVSGNSYNCYETDLANNYDLRVSVEYNGQSVLLKWNGSNTRTVLAGEALALSDKLSASSFGLTKFTKGDQFWLRMERITPVGGNMMYHYAAVNDPAISGERFFTAALAGTDMLSATGDWPTSGGWTSLAVVWLPCCVIGEVRGNKMSAAVLGASIEHGAGDYGRGDGLSGSGGYIRRGFGVKKGARISLMKATESAKSFVLNSAKRRVLLQYCTHAYVAHGGNDYSYGYSEAATQTAMTTIWGWCKAANLKVIHIGLSVKTDSTNVWIDQANQTPRAGFEIGGAWRDAFHTWAFSKVGTLIDRFLTMDASQSALAQSGSRDKWRTDLGQASLDGTHPTAVIHDAMGTQFAAELETDRASFEV